MSVDIQRRKYILQGVKKDVYRLENDVLTRE